MAGAKAFGMQNPTQGETAVSWQTWSDGAAGIPDVQGDADWGKLELDLNPGEEGRSAVYDLGSTATRTFTLTENRYGSGQNDAILQYRTDTSSFAQDDALPAWTTYTGVFSVSCRYIQIRETTIGFSRFYVDNEATGANDGTSWADAWESFADINWTTLQNASQAHLYFSGGSTSKIYTNPNGGETWVFWIGGNGTAGDFIVIDVGANSPSPSGHDGVVIFDGEDAKAQGIRASSNGDCVFINGRDSSGNLKMRVQGVASGGNSIHCYQRNYTYFDYIDIDNIKSRGVWFGNANDCRARGCDIQTGNVAYDIETDGIYAQYGAGNIFEDNTVILGNNAASSYHCDVIQFVSEDAPIVRRNHLEWTSGRGNANCQAFISESSDNNVYIENNLIIGCSLNLYNVLQFTSITSGKLYLWNNTIVAQNAARGDVVHLQGFTESNIGAIKNNIIYSPNGYCLHIENAVVTGSIINNNCLYTGGSYVSEINGTERTWANHQAAGYDANGINVDPDYNSGDEYRLNSTSDCIDAGADLSANFTTDKDGVLRPIGAWDIGAYEYTA